MSSLLDELLGYALNIGLSEERFWTMTIPEVNREIKAFNWREKRHNQFISSVAYKIPTLIAIAVLDAKKYPEIYEMFPDEFEEKEVQDVKQKQQVQKDVATFRAWAESFNKRKESKESQE